MSEEWKARVAESDLITQVVGVVGAIYLMGLLATWAFKKYLWKRRSP